MTSVDVTEELEVPCTPEELFVWVEDLGRYPSWLDIVVRAEPVEPHAGDAGPAWSVDLRGRLGPFARSKRLRMVRTRYEPPHEVAFERAELDGRQHSPWVMHATVTRADSSPSGADRAETSTATSASRAPATVSRAGGPSPTTGGSGAEGSVPAARPASVLTMRLHYGGTLADAMVERLLADEIRRSKPRLLAALGAGAGR